MCTVTHTLTQSWLFSMWYTVSLWLSVFCERPESLFGDWQAHRGRYTMLMSQSGLNTQKPVNATFTFNPFQMAAWAELETHINASDFWQIKQSHRDTGAVLCRAKQAWTREMENEIMRQMRTRNTQKINPVSPYNTGNIHWSYIFLLTGGNL